ncbi:MAG: Ca2+-binding RTX toxin-like protein, partial [Cognaticolwellia sp.]
QASLLGAALLSVMALSSGVAQAACPSPFSSSTCATGGSAVDVCQLDAGGTTWTCDLNRAGGTAGNGVATVVYDPATYGYDAWGQDIAGNQFCCVEPQGSIDTVVLDGGPGQDDLSFTEGTFPGARNLRGPIGTTIDAECNGGDGNDLIDGSDYLTLINETLNGGGHDDVIVGLGNDDVINGGEGDDQIEGGAGNDTLNGDNGADEIKGGSGDDTISGGAGADDLCGDGGADDLSGDGGDDYLDAGPAAPDDLDGGAQPTNDYCTTVGVGGSRSDCEAYFFPTGGGTCFF